MLSHYEALHLTSEASASEIKQAYHSAVLRLHPDKRTADSPDVEAVSSKHELERVQAAWQVLRNPAQRALYDEELKRQAWLASMHVSDTLSASELLRDRSVAGRTTLSHTCRCGGAYVLETAELNEQLHGSVLVPCDTCSLCIEVLLQLGAVEGATP